MKPSGSCLESCSGTEARSKGWHLARKSFKAATSRLGSCWLSPASWNLFPKAERAASQTQRSRKPLKTHTDPRGKSLPSSPAISNTRFPFKTSTPYKDNLALCIPCEGLVPRRLGLGWEFTVCQLFHTHSSCEDACRKAR